MIQYVCKHFFYHHKYHRHQTSKEQTPLELVNNQDLRYIS